MDDIQIGRWTQPERRWLGLAVLLALILRLAFVFGYWVDKPLTVDQTEYLMLADNLRAGNGLTYGDSDDDAHRLMRSPGYPLFLAAVRTVSPGIEGVKAAQAMLGALSVLLVAALARRLGGGRAAVFAAFLMACYPPQIFQPGYVLSETLFTALGLVALILCWRVLDTLDTSNTRHEPSPGKSSLLGGTVAAGIAVGLTVLTRPEFLLFSGLLSLWLVWYKHLGTAAVWLTVTAATVAPWPIYNVLAHDRVVMLSSRGGPNLWMGNNEHTTGDGDVSGNAAMDTAYQQISRANQTLPPEEIERAFYTKTFAYVREQPGDFIGNVVRKAFYFWVPVGRSYQQRSVLYWAAQALSFLGLLVITIRALPRFLRIDPIPTVLVVSLASVYLTCLIFFPLARYRVPMFDPVLIAIASLGLHCTYRRGASTVSRR